MRKTVNAESSLVDKEHSPEASVHESSPEVSPCISGNRKRQEKSKEKSNRKIMPVLEHNAAVGIEIANVNAAGATGVLLEHHPTDMGIPKALVDGVRILSSINVAMVGAVVSAPPASRAFEGSGAPCKENKLDRP